MTEEQQMTARELRNKGLSYRKISVAIGVPRSTVRYNLSSDTKKRHSEYMREYNKAHKTEKGEYMKRYYLEHKAERTAYLAHYREKNREKAKRYAAEYRDLHRDKIIRAMARYYEKNKASFLRYMHNYYREHKAEFESRNAKRRALQKGACADLSAEQVGAVKEIYRRAKKDENVRCYLCGKRIPLGHRHVDHIIPLSRGGAHVAQNLAIACDKCNLRKGTRLPEEIGLLL